MSDLLPATIDLSDADSAQAEAPSRPATGPSKILGEAGALAFGVIDRQIARLADAIDGAAEAVETVVGGVEPALPQGIGGFATSASGRLRTLSDTVRSQEGKALASDARDVIARHSTIAMGIGAVLGAVAMGLVARSGRDAVVQPG